MYANIKYLNSLNIDLCTLSLSNWRALSPEERFRNGGFPGRVEGKRHEKKDVEGGGRVQL